MEILDQINILNDKIRMMSYAIESLQDAINNGNVSHRETSLEEDLNNLIIKKNALEFYKDSLTASL